MYNGKDESATSYRNSDEKRGRDFEWTHRPHTTTVFPVERQEVVAGERKHKECCVVGEGERQGKYDGTVDCRRVLDEKERNWMTRMTCCDTRRVA